MREEEGIILITESRSLAHSSPSLMIREFNSLSYNNVYSLNTGKKKKKKDACNGYRIDGLQNLLCRVTGSDQAVKVKNLQQIFGVHWENLCERLIK